jgi:DNA-binding transcriptional LysR family regulator
MELRHLRYFVATAEELSFTRAAEKLHLAQPSLTRQIRNLEEEIGVRLLDRSKKHVSLTEEGISFLVDARRVLALAEESVRAVQRLSRGEATQLNIAYPANTIGDLLPDMLGVFRQSFPQVALNLFEMTPAEQFSALEARKIDLGFVGRRFSAAAKNLQWASIGRHATVAVLPANLPLAKRRCIRLKDLKPLFFVGMSEKTSPAFHEWLHETCQQAGFTPRILQDAELEAGLITLVREGLGVTLAREQIKKLPHEGVALRPLAPPVKTDYWIAWNAGNPSKPLQEFIQIAKSLSEKALKTDCSSAPGTARANWPAVGRIAARQ